jgi:hypothetical protein
MLKQLVLYKLKRIVSDIRKLRNGVEKNARQFQREHTIKIATFRGFFDLDENNKMITKD